MTYRLHRLKRLREARMWRGLTFFAREVLPKTLTIDGDVVWGLFEPMVIDVDAPGGENVNYQDIDAVFGEHDYVDDDNGVDE